MELKKRIVVKLIKEKESFLFTFFIDSEGLGHLPTYPWRIKTS